MEFIYAERKDTPVILAFIRELADYEQLLHEVVADEETLEDWTVYRIAGETLKKMGTERE